MLSPGLCGIILAAGESSRMGRDKALLPWPPIPSNVLAVTPIKPSTILSSAIDAVTPYCDSVIVVAGKNAEALQSTVYARAAFLVVNPAPERGQFSSLQTGLQAVLDQGRDSAIITLVDRPPARPATLAKLVDAFANRAHKTWAVVPEYEGKHGHPVIIGREMLEKFLKAPANSNAQEIEHAHQSHIAYVAIDDPLVTKNVDTPDDYASLELGQRVDG